MKGFKLKAKTPSGFKLKTKTPSGFKRTVALIALHSLTPSVQAKTTDKTKAVIHHTASHDVPATEIDLWHRARGWHGIGYHFVIRKDGTVEDGRDINRVGAHALGRNHYLGIALTGYDEFTPAQISALIGLLRQLRITHVEAHHDRCPGLGLDMVRVRGYLGSGYARKGDR